MVIKIEVKEIITKCGEIKVEILKAEGLPAYPCLKNVYMAGKNMHRFFRAGEKYTPAIYHEGLCILHAAIANYQESEEEK